MNNKERMEIRKNLTEWLQWQRTYPAYDHQSNNHGFYISLIKTPSGFTNVRAGVSGISSFCQQDGVKYPHVLKKDIAKEIESFCLATGIGYSITSSTTLTRRKLMASGNGS